MHGADMQCDYSRFGILCGTKKKLGKFSADIILEFSTQWCRNDWQFALATVVTTVYSNWKVTRKVNAP